MTRATDEYEPSIQEIKDHYDWCKMASFKKLNKALKTANISLKEIILDRIDKVQNDVDGKPYFYIDKMSVRQYYSHGGPGWDYRFSHPKYNVKTQQVEDDSVKE